MKTIPSRTITALVALTGLALLALPGCSSSTQTDTPTQPPNQTTQTNTPAVRYTCPMHPEVLQDQPGDCPKCGEAGRETLSSYHPGRPEASSMASGLRVSLRYSSKNHLLPFAVYSYALKAGEHTVAQQPFLPGKDRPLLQIRRNRLESNGP
jgi:hypothetical protein